MTQFHEGVILIIKKSRLKQNCARSTSVPQAAEDDLFVATFLRQSRKLFIHTKSQHYVISLAATHY
ncbi:hypothetical protein C7W93_09500 [Glaciimonas sp. PCH181]|nr:hypothetical protein C7W93_09500 [Glaciimonas sp. PCH181]